MAIEATRVSRFRVPAIAAGEMVPAGCCPVPAAAAAVQILMFMDGVEDVVVDETSGELAVSHDPERVAAADLAEELTFIGLPAEAL
ncbi:MAG TPA: hypothetical protein VGL23_06225 [Chloroflexota bacterium]|jgi:hypothetical protein